MWGENWGAMIWGSGITIETVPLGPWALLLLGVVIGACGVLANRHRKARVPLFFALLVPVMGAVAFTVPNTFTNGTTADAAQVNANFAAIASIIGTPPAVTSITASTPDLGLGPQPRCDFSAIDTEGDHLSVSVSHFYDDNLIATSASAVFAGSVSTTDLPILPISSGQDYRCEAQGYDGKQLGAIAVSSTVVVP
ncbi:MAG: hypothetical protein AAF384_17025 [Pseudomonadota bacterium]